MNFPEWKFDAAHVKSWAEEGRKAGEYAQKVFVQTESAVKDMLLTIAGIIAGTPSAEDWLTGYAASWANKLTGKSRKTDARAVFEAYKLKDAANNDVKEVTLIVGYEKDDKGANKKDAQGNAIPIKVTKSPAEWLLEYDMKEGHGSKDGFQGFLALARTVRNNAVGSGRTSQGTTVNRKTKVTEAQFSGIMENIPVMSASQAMATANETAKVIAKLPEAPKVFLAEMEMICNQLKALKGPYSDLAIEAAAGILDVIHETRSKMEEREKLQKEALANTSSKTAGQAQSDFQAPAPAQKEEKAA